MALNKQELQNLMLVVAKADRNAPVAYSFGDHQYSYADLNETLRSELNELSGTYSDYRENKNVLFSLIEKTVEDILPARVKDQYGMFADIQSFGQGDKPVFTRKEGRQRAKQFITKVGLAGIYEVFKLDTSTYEVPTSAFGGAAQIGLEEFLDGRVDFADLLSVILEGLDDVVYSEIAKSLIAGINNLPEANSIATAGFSEGEFDKLLAVARAYGDPIIYCTYELAAKIVPAELWVSDGMKDARNKGGFIPVYKGAKIIVLPQSFTDETNKTKVIDPSFAWIIPTGGNDKPIKVAFEGATIVDEYVNKDRSREVQVYKKLGVVAMMTNNICVYEDTTLKK